jgi:pyruvate dehydrogenase E2 component (dihydrolipoamide acetyltransferase)
MSAASLSETVGVAAAGGEPVPAVPAESPSAESPAEPAGEAPREDEPAAAKPEPSSEPAPSPAVSIVESALETEPSAVGPESAVEAEPAVEPESAAVSAEASAEPVAESAAEAGPDGSLTFQTPLREACKPTAARSRAALAGHVQASFDTSAPAANLLNLRRRLKSSDPALGMAGVTIGDLVAYAAVQVARRHPTVNAIVVGDVATACEDVHLGLAVDTPRGLVVPTIRNASSLGLRQFSAQANELAALARSGPIGADLLSGATFTVANLGAYGIESFTPVLSVPQAAILGANTIFPRPVIRPDGSYGVEQRIGFSLTVDHEVVDGADAARYLADLVTLVADIDIAVLD